MTPEYPPLPPNIISLCSPWLPKNGMQGHYKGIILEVCLVMWVDSHLSAVIPPIAFSLSPIFPSVSYCVMPLVLILDSV